MHSCLPSYMYMCISLMSGNVLYCIYALFRAFTPKIFHLPLFWFWFCPSLNQLTGSHFRVLRTASHSLALQRKPKPWTRRSITRSVCDVQWRLRGKLLIRACWDLGVFRYLKFWGISETVLFVTKRNTFHLMHTKMSMNIIIVTVWLSEDSDFLLCLYYWVPSVALIGSARAHKNRQLE